MSAFDREDVTAAEGGVAARAVDLLGRVIRLGLVGVRITEVEAYGGVHDPASHAYVRTPRSEIMYGPSMRLYVYQIHGHFCANIVTGPRESASAVLLRSGEVVDGEDAARLRRGDVADHQLARGPGNLTRALGITMEHRGLDVREGPVVLGEHHTPVDTTADVSSGPRVGVRLAADVPWRFWLTGDRTVSAYRRHPKAARLQ